ncbi:MAG: single-stranded DNA-binding protein [Candidatus Cloacimonadota bacterium]|nr:single-stranded DNA-binding protein [Candidatus Cloacimonadota bacterium]
MAIKTPNINNVTLAGNIVRDPEIREVGEKKTKVTTITVANNRPYQDKDGKWQKETTFVDAEVWGLQAEKLGEYGKKGTPVIVEGNLKLNKWEDKEGKSYSKLRIRANRIHILNYPEK